VYLAGPILDCSGSEANDWRYFMDKALKPFGVEVVSPLRCEPIIGEKYQVTYDADPCFGTAGAIFAKNLFDAQRCDVTVAYLPKPPDGRRQSYGTIAELALAFAYGRSTVLVSDDPNVKNHPLLAGLARWSLDSLDDAVRLLKG